MRATIEALTYFINRERERFSDREGNIFAFAFMKISRSCQYLKIILARYEEVSAAFLENTRQLHGSMREGTHVVTDEEWQLHLAAVDLTTRLHLEIESFYLFAKILLDQVAHALEFYFGPARGLSLDSHDGLTKCLSAYSQHKALSAPSEELSKLVSDLKSNISDYRDYDIAHEKSPRTLKATGFSLGKQPGARILNTKLYPGERDVQTESRSLRQLEDLIDRYLRIMINWIETNRDKCRLPAKGL